MGGMFVFCRNLLLLGWAEDGAPDGASWLIVFMLSC